MSTIIIFDSETFGLSPAEKKFTLVKNGIPTLAELEIQFTESFGYGLVEAFLNGVRIKAQSSTSLKTDVKHIIKNGENKLTVVFNALQIFGNPLGQTTISAFVTYAGASIVEIPSVSQGLDAFADGIKKNIPVVLALAVAGAVAIGSIAFISSRLPSFGGIKIKNPVKQLESGLGHAIMTVKNKVDL